MLRRLNELRMALTVLLNDADTTKKKEDRALLLTDGEWRLTGDIVHVLSEFEKATTVASGSQYVTLSPLLPIITHLSSSMVACTSSVDTAACRQLAETLKVELVKKFPAAHSPQPNRHHRSVFGIRPSLP